MKSRIAFVVLRSTGEGAGKVERAFPGSLFPPRLIARAAMKGQPHAKRTTVGDGSRIIGKRFEMGAGDDRQGAFMLRGRSDLSWRRDFPCGAVDTQLRGPGKRRADIEIETKISALDQTEQKPLIDQVGI